MGNTIFATVCDKIPSCFTTLSSHLGKHLGSYAKLLYKLRIWNIFESSKQEEQTENKSDDKHEDN